MPLIALHWLTSWKYIIKIMLKQDANVRDRYFCLDKRIHLLEYKGKKTEYNTKVIKPGKGEQP
jgi:hypothetical protein